MEDKINVETYYEKCRVILSALEYAPKEDRDALIWMMQECFCKLGEAIDGAIGKSPMK